MEERGRKRGGGGFTFEKFNLKSVAVQWGGVWYLCTYYVCNPLVCFPLCSLAMRGYINDTG